MADDPIYGLSKEQHAALGRLLKTTKGGSGSIAGAAGGGRRAATVPKVPVEPRPEWLKVNGNDAGGGKYDVTLMTATAKTGASGNASLPEHAVTRTAGFIAINAEETGLPTHWVKADESKYALGRRIGVSDDDGKPVFVFDGAYYRNSSPSTIGPNSGTSTKYWHRDETASGDKFGDCPIDLYVVTRGSGASLYQRKITFDAGGKWFMVGPEETPTTLTTTNITIKQDGSVIETGTVFINFKGPIITTDGSGGVTVTGYPQNITNSSGGDSHTITASSVITFKKLWTNSTGSPVGYDDVTVINSDMRGYILEVTTAYCATLDSDDPETKYWDGTGALDRWSGSSSEVFREGASENISTELPVIADQTCDTSDFQLHMTTASGTAGRLELDVTVGAHRKFQVEIIIRTTKLG